MMSRRDESDLAEGVYFLAPTVGQPLSMPGRQYQTVEVCATCFTVYVCTTSAHYLPSGRAEVVGHFLLPIARELGFRCLRPYPAVTVMNRHRRASTPHGSRRSGRVHSPNSSSSSSNLDSKSFRLCCLSYPMVSILSIPMVYCVGSNRPRYHVVLLLRLTFFAHIPLYFHLQGS